MMLPSLLPSRTVLARAALAALVVVLLGSGCASLEEKEREWTFRVVKSDAGWYSGTPAGRCRTSTCP